MYKNQRRVERNNTLQHFTNPYAPSCAQERKGRTITIQQNRARTRMVQSLQQRLNCPARVPKPKPPAPVESRYEEILYPPITYEGYQSDMFPWAFARIQKIVPRPPNCKETQVEDEHLFNFCQEVQPHLEILVGTAVTQAMHEATNDDEHFMEQAERSNFRGMVKAERAEKTRVEKQDRRLREERQRREIQFPIGCRNQKERAAVTEPMHRVKKIEREMTLANVLEGSRSNDYRADVIKKELEASLNPQLLQHVDVMCSTNDTSRGLLTKMVHGVITNRSQGHDIADATGCGGKSCISNGDDWALQDDEEWQIESVGADSEAHFTTTDDESQTSSVFRGGKQTSGVYDQSRKKMSILSERKKTVTLSLSDGSAETNVAIRAITPPDYNSSKRNSEVMNSRESWAGVIEAWM